MAEAVEPIAQLLEQLNTEYEQLHIRKEDLFWSSYMGLADDAQKARQELEEAEIELQRWLQDPGRLAGVRTSWEQASQSEVPLTDEQRLSLEGWVRTFQAHAIESEEGQRLSEEVIRLETKLAETRADMKLGYQSDGQDWTPASSVELSGMLRTDPDPQRRKAAWQGLRSIETCVLEGGFLEVVRQRNRLGRLLGGEDYYDWKTRRVEGMPKAEIFELLDELEARTRVAGETAVRELQRIHGATLTPWNVQYLIAGDVTNELDPYFPFATSFDVWGRSFSALGADFQGARLVLDLLDRPGKYENGFMHGPVPAWRKPEGFQPARIHFTANAIPSLAGAGQRGLETFFHEGGHAIHFANIDMPSPCFSQEFAPTSVAYAEIQSMIMDSLINDADWLCLYAKTRDGKTIPFELIAKSIEAKQPFAAWMARAMMIVPYTERAIYELPEEELTAENVLRICRDVERRMLGMSEGSFRPVLSVPHVISGDASAYYHGYVLADMGVHQTRNFLIERDGFLVDNPSVAPTLREKYWQPGNRYGLHTYLERMTGSRLSAAHFASRVNRGTDEALAQARSDYARVESSQAFTGPVNLNASVAVVHGRETIVDTESQSFEEAAQAFAGWIDGQPK